MNVMRKILILCLVLAWGVTGCYEDKGDYDYKTLAQISIGNIRNSYTLIVGDTLKIEPEIAVDIEAEVGLKYKWTVEFDSLFSNKRDIEYIIPVDAPKEMKLVLQVSDTLSGLTFMTQTIVRVNPLYLDAFIILSEKDGVSSLSALKRSYTGNYSEEDWDRFFYNIYEGIEGESLKGKPVQIHLHDLGTGTDQHMMLLQDDFNECMDLDADNLKKSLELPKEFQVVPQNANLKQAFFSSWYSYLLDEDGRVFSRKNFSSEAFHTGYFSSYPLVFMEPDAVGNETAHQLKVDRFVYDMNNQSGFVFVYEKEKNRFLYLYGSSSYGTIGIPCCANYPSGFIPLDDLGDNELIATSGYWWKDYYYSAGGLYNIIKRADGSYVGQMLHTDDPTAIEAVVQRKFNGSMMNDNILLLIPDDGQGRFVTCPYAFIASGNVLYYFDKNENTDQEIVPKRYYEFPAEITAMEDEFYSNEYLCVGLANGEVYLLKINGSGFTSQEQDRVVLKMTENVGRVKSIIYRQ